MHVLEVAASGGYNVLMMGTAGASKILQESTMHAGSAARAAGQD
ncbi:MAG: hypothetical protein ABSA01_09145 [Anaerolineales bacterium]|jgi:transcriptional regulator with AAA-type ATPase domain